MPLLKKKGGGTPPAPTEPTLIVDVIENTQKAIHTAPQLQISSNTPITLQYGNTVFTLGTGAGTYTIRFKDYGYIGKYSLKGDFTEVIVTCLEGKYKVGFTKNFPNLKTFNFDASDSVNANDVDVSALTSLTKLFLHGFNHGGEIAVGTLTGLTYLTLSNVLTSNRTIDFTGIGEIVSTLTLNYIHETTNVLLPVFPNVPSGTAGLKSAGSFKEWINRSQAKLTDKAKSYLDKLPTRNASSKGTLEIEANATVKAEVVAYMNGKHWNVVDW